MQVVESLLRRTDNDQKQRTIVPQRESRDLLARQAEADVDAVVSGAITNVFECHDDVTEIGCELALPLKHDSPYRRMQAVGTNHQVESPRRCTFKIYCYAVILVFNGHDTVVEENLHSAFYPLINCFRECTPRQSQIASVSERAENIDAKPSGTFPTTIDEPEFF